MLFVSCPFQVIAFPTHTSHTALTASSCLPGRLPGSHQPLTGQPAMHAAELVEGDPGPLRTPTIVVLPDNKLVQATNRSLGCLLCTLQSWWRATPAPCASPSSLSCPTTNCALGGSYAATGRMRLTWSGAAPTLSRTARWTRPSRETATTSCRRRRGRAAAAAACRAREVSSLRGCCAGCFMLRVLPFCTRGRRLLVKQATELGGTSCARCPERLCAALGGG